MGTFGHGTPQSAHWKSAGAGRARHYRGGLAGTELALWAASHNTLKAITARGKRLTRQAPAAPTAA